jgi:hypothetical protein
MVIFRPNRWQRKSPTNEKTIAGRKSEAVMIPRRLLLGLPKYLDVSQVLWEDILVPGGNGLDTCQEGLVIYTSVSVGARE